MVAAVQAAADRSTRMHACKDRGGKLLPQTVHAHHPGARFRGMCRACAEKLKTHRATGKGHRAKMQGVCHRRVGYSPLIRRCQSL
eukprot:scaffold121084_cov14-Tisochrysis_lutea.AAC.1